MCSGIEGQKVVSSSASEDPLIKKGRDVREVLSEDAEGRLGKLVDELSRSAESERKDEVLCIDCRCGILCWKRWLPKAMPDETRQSSRLQLMLEVLERE
jgi:hypothetical protein